MKPQRGRASPLQRQCQLQTNTNKNQQAARSQGSCGASFIYKLLSCVTLGANYYFWLCVCVCVCACECVCVRACMNVWFCVNV